MEVRKLKCHQCGGAIQLDDDRQVLFCPYCGSQELLIDNDSDEVKIARITSRTALAKQKEKNRHEEEMRKVTENDLIKNRDDNRNSLIVTSICLIVMLLVLLICRSMM